MKTHVERAPMRLALLFPLLLAGCDVGPNGRKIQYVPDMADSPAPKAQKEYLEPPEGAVAMNAIFYPKTVEEAEKMLTMPDAIAKDPQLAQKGEQLFNTFCIACHGQAADGKNHLGPNFPPPPNLTADVYKQHADGFFFYRITFGGSLMPAYGHAISAYERWQIIAHVRNLQKAAPK
jgi:mono/diheme cytochrome c family protein